MYFGENPICRFKKNQKLHAVVEQIAAPEPLYYAL